MGETILLAMGVVAATVGAMSIGVLCGRKPIQGSCGGLGAAGLASSCDICGGQRSQCRKRGAERIPASNY